MSRESYKNSKMLKGRKDIALLIWREIYNIKKEKRREELDEEDDEEDTKRLARGNILNLARVQHREKKRPERERKRDKWR